MAHEKKKNCVSRTIHKQKDRADYSIGNVTCQPGAAAVARAVRPAEPRLVSAFLPAVRVRYYPAGDLLAFQGGRSGCQRFRYRYRIGLRPKLLG